MNLANGPGDAGEAPCFVGKPAISGELAKISSPASDVRRDLRDACATSSRWCKRAISAKELDVPTPPTPFEINCAVDGGARERIFRHWLGTLSQVLAQLGQNNVAIFDAETLVNCSNMTGGAMFGIGQNVVAYALILCASRDSNGTTAGEVYTKKRPAAKGRG